MKLVLDVEATGLKETDDILQLATIILNSNDSVFAAYNFYFKTDKKYAEAYIINGLLKEKLANSNYNQDNVKQIMKIILKDVDTLIGYNLMFDLNLIFNKCDDVLINNIYNLNKLDMMKDLDWYKAGFDSKKGFTKHYLRLEESVSKMINSGTDINDMKKEYQQIFNTKDANFHDARWDTYTTYLLYRDYYKKLNL